MAAATHAIEVAGERVVLDWTPPAAGRTEAAVFVHGLGSHRRGEKALHFAERFAALGWGFLSLDLRGHGESGGRMRDLSLSRCIADLSAALAWLPGGASPRLLIGSSMGGAVVAWHRVLHPAPGPLMSLIAPAFGFPRRMAEGLAPAELETWRLGGVHNFRSEWIDLEIGWGLMEDARAFDPVRLRREWATPMLILHGMRDVAVDWRDSVAFVEGCPFPDLELLLIKAGDHRLTDQRAHLFDAMASWLRARGAIQA